MNTTFQLTQRINSKLEEEIFIKKNILEMRNGKKNRFSILVKFQDGILSLNYLSAIQSSGIFTFLSKKQVTYWKNIGTAMVK
jgi:hypothetical protein